MIFWNEGGELVCIATEESFYILRYNSMAVDKAREQPDTITEDGVEEAFDVLSDVQETVKTGCWVGDCFIYSNSVNRLNYYVGGEIVTIAHLDRVMYLLGYIPKDNRVYLGDKELNVVSYSVLLSVLEYQTAVMRQDFETADKVLPTVPKEQRTRVAHFLEKQGFRPQAMAVTCDPEHKFELALQLGDLKIAYQLATETESEQKWKQLAELATLRCEFGLAQECLHQAQDFGALTLLASAAGNTDMIARVGAGASKAGQNNVAFLSYFVLGNLEECLKILVETNRLPEAAFFARTYLPSELSRIVTMWRESLAKKNPKAAQSLANPTEYENLFPNLHDALKTEQFLREKRRHRTPASSYPTIDGNQERLPVVEMCAAEKSGEFTYVPPEPTTGDDVVEEDYHDESISFETDHVNQQMTASTKSVVQTSTTVTTDKQHPPSSPPAAVSTFESCKPSTVAAATASVPAKSPTALIDTKTATQLEDLETELELDLENMKLDNIDTTGIETEDLDDWE